MPLPLLPPPGPQADPKAGRTATRALLILAVIPLLLALWSGAAAAQSLTLDLGAGGAGGGGPELSTRTFQLLAMITLLSIVPGLAVTITCFPFIVTVLSILRQAIGLQQAPPNMLIISLALFLTWFVMDPVLTSAWDNGLQPLSEGRLDLTTALPEILGPFRSFMAARLDGETFASLQALRPVEGPAPAPEAAPLSLLVPAFLLSEIARAFQIGFLIFLPFLIIDLVVSAVLMSMGMMMLPPAVVALPFKLAFFVVADGWSLLSSALVRGYL